MQDPMISAGLFLINTVFDLYLIVLMARLILAWSHADYNNPLTQGVITLTQPFVKPLKKFLPTVRGIELSTVVIILVLDMIKFTLIGMLAISFPNNIFGLPILACADFLKLLLNTFFYAILISAILSWIQPGYSPVARALQQITYPVMRHFQKYIPPVSGFDFSPIAALIFLQLLIILVCEPLLAVGMRATFG
jgi:YggT family protein